MPFDPGQEAAQRTAEEANRRAHKSSLPTMRPERKEAIKQKLREVSQQMDESQIAAASDEDRKPN